MVTIGGFHVCSPPAVYEQGQEVGPLCTCSCRRRFELDHFYASELLGANVHPKVVSDQLGHSSVAFTMDTYSHLMPSAGKAGDGGARFLTP